MKSVARTALVLAIVTAPIALAARQASSPVPTTILFEAMRFVSNRIDAVAAGRPIGDLARQVAQPATPVGPPR